MERRGVALAKPAEQSADYEAFAAFVREMRDLGAIRVRDGGLEVVLREPPPVPVVVEREPRGEVMVRELSRGEREELEDFRRRQRYAEEIP